MISRFSYREILTSPRLNEIVDYINSLKGFHLVEYKSGHIYPYEDDSTPLTFLDLISYLDGGLSLIYGGQLFVPSYVVSPTSANVIEFYNITESLSGVILSTISINELNAISTGVINLTELSMVTQVNSEFSEDTNYSKDSFVIYNGNLIKFKQTHSAGQLSPSEFDVVNLENLSNKLESVSGSISTDLTDIVNDIHNLQTAVTNLQAKNVRLATADIPGQSGRIIPMGSTLNEHDELVGSSINGYIYTRTYTSYGQKFRVFELPINSNIVKVNVITVSFSYSGFINYKLYLGDIDYAFTDSPSISENFYLVKDNTHIYLCYRVNTANDTIKIESVSPSPLIEVSDSSQDTITIVPLFTKAKNNYNLVTVSGATYEFNDTVGGLITVDGVSFTGNSATRDLTDVTTTDWTQGFNSWRLYNDSDVDLTEVTLTAGGSQVLDITEEVPRGSYLEVYNSYGTWSYILVVPNPDGLTVTYPLIKSGSSDNINLSLDLASTVDSSNKLITAALLSNYAYSKTEINNLLAGTLTYQAVNSLPTQDIKTNVIYLVPNGSQSGSNVRDEYIYLNNQWELIGSTQVDLSNYYNKSEVDALVATRELMSNKVTSISNNVQSTSVNYPTDYAVWKFVNDNKATLRTYPNPSQTTKFNLVQITHTDNQAYWQGGSEYYYTFYYRALLLLTGGSANPDFYGWMYISTGYHRSPNTSFNANTSQYVTASWMMYHPSTLKYSYGGTTITHDPVVEIYRKGDYSEVRIIGQLPDVSWQGLAISIVSEEYDPHYTLVKYGSGADGVPGTFDPTGYVQETISDQGNVQSITLNGVRFTPTNGDVNLGNVGGGAAESIAKLLPTSSAPSSPSSGDIYYDTTEGNLKIYQNNEWRNIQNEQSVYLVPQGAVVPDGTLSVTSTYPNWGTSIRLYYNNSWHSVSAVAASIQSTNSLPTSGGYNNQTWFLRDIKKLVTYWNGDWYYSNGDKYGTGPKTIAQVVTFTNSSGEIINAIDIESVIVTASFGSNSILDLANVEKIDGKSIDILNLSGNKFTLKDGANEITITSLATCITRVVCMSSTWSAYMIGNDSFRFLKSGANPLNYTLEVGISRIFLYTVPYGDTNVINLPSFSTQPDDACIVYIDYDIRDTVNIINSGVTGSPTLISLTNSNGNAGTKGSFVIQYSKVDGEWYICMDNTVNSIPNSFINNLN